MKTESAVFGTRQQLDQVCIDSIKVDATSIQPWRPMSTRFALKLIMVSANPEVSFWRDHKDACPCLHRISSWLLQCASFWHPWQAHETNSTYVQCRCQSCFLVPKFDHISPVLVRLHWLPVQYRVQFKILLLVFKCLIGEAPEYLRSMIQPKKISRPGLRSESGILLEVPRVRCSTRGSINQKFFITLPTTHLGQWCC